MFFFFQIENLRVERDEQVALAARRLQELEEVNRRVQSLTQENSKLKMEVKFIESNFH